MDPGTAQSVSTLTVVLILMLILCLYFLPCTPWRRRAIRRDLEKRASIAINPWDSPFPVSPSTPHTLLRTPQTPSEFMKELQADRSIIDSPTLLRTPPPVYNPSSPRCPAYGLPSPDVSRSPKTSTSTNSSLTSYRALCTSSDFGDGGDRDISGIFNYPCDYDRDPHGANYRSRPSQTHTTTRREPLPFVSDRDFPMPPQHVPTPPKLDSNGGTHEIHQKARNSTRIPSFLV